VTISAQRICVYVLLILWSCVAEAQAGQEMQTVRVTEGPTITYVDDQFAVVAWTTNVPTESRVFYGTQPEDLNQVAESLQASTLHRVDLRNLKPDATYYFQLDIPGSEIPPVLQFRTVAAGAAPLHRQRPGQEASAQPAPAAGVTITRGPTIEFADDRSAVISWTTNEPAPTLVYYGTRRSDLSQTAEAGGNTTFHRVHLSGLQPATTYFFLVDSGQGQQTGQVNSFETAAAEGAPIYNQQAMAAGKVAAPPNAPALDNRPAEERPRRRSGKEVPAGIEIQATLQNELSTKTSHYGDKFTAIVSQPVNATDGSVGIPAGSRITGEVIESEQGKTVALLRGRGKINIRFRDLILPDGTTLPLNASLESVHNMKANEEGQVQGGIGGKTAAKDVGVGAGLGTVAGLIFGSALKGLAIGAIAGGGYMLATKGKDVEIPANSGMVLRLEQALYVPAHTGGR
jgi:type IV secretory pathway VirB10-like protein